MSDEADNDRPFRDRCIQLAIESRTTGWTDVGDLISAAAAIQQYIAGGQTTAPHDEGASAAPSIEDAERRAREDGASIRELLR